MPRSMAPCTTQSWLANDAFGFVLGLMGSRASTNLAENWLWLAAPGEHRGPGVEPTELAKRQDEGRKSNGPRRNVEAASPTG